MNEAPRSPVYPSGRDAAVLLIMPVRNEALDLPETLQSLEQQTIDHRRLRLVIIDGDSQDTTTEIAANWLAEHDISGKIIHNKQRTIPTSLNLGIAESSGSEIIVRLDGHTLYGPTYLSELITTLEHAPDDVACVGGPQRPISDNTFEHRLVATLYSNPMGLGGADHRHGKGLKYVTQVYLGAWRPGVMQQLGGFDTAWKANEDSELSARILQAGGRILWAPLDCTYGINRGVIQSIRQWGSYGFWRAQTLRRYPQLAKPRHFMAPLALLLGLLCFLSPARGLLLVAVVLYAGAVLAKRSPKDSLLTAAAGTVFFPCCQCAWSLGLLRGLLRTPPPFTRRNLAEAGEL